MFPKILPLSNYILYAYSVYPLSFLLAIQEKGSYELTDDMRQKAFQSAWDAIKV